MRNTKEIADAVFKIRDEHLEQKKLLHKRIEKACAAVSALAAAGIITAAVLYSPSDIEPPRSPESILAADTTSVPVTSIVTTVSDISVSVPVSTYTSAAATDFKITTAVSTAAKSTTAAVTAAAVTQTASNVQTAATAVNTAVPAAVQTTQTPVTTDISESDCEEVIRMKVINVKKYLAALSAAALASSGVQMPAYASELYTPKELDPLADSIIYIEDNPQLFDFDGSGKTDPFDAYALYTYVNEPSSLPEGYAERCKAGGDVNNDGKIDSADSELLSEMYIYKFSEDQFRAYYDNYDYLTPWIKNSYEYTARSLSDDAPEDVKEKLKINEFIDSCYPYGSEKNVNSFVERCFKVYLNGIEWEESFKYNDAAYKRFADDAKKRNYSFDVNEDGVTDLKDLYDIYIYDAASADDFGPINKEDYFMRFNTITTGEGINETINYNFDVKLRDRLTLSEDEKQKLWDKCEPIYDYVYSFIDYEKKGPQLGNNTVFGMIGRYIMNNTELDYINTKSVYYMQYHKNLKLCDIDVAEWFTNSMLSIAYWNFNKAGVDPTGQNENPKLYTLIMDYDYMNDNDVLIAVDKQAKADFDSGLTSELYDINKDGKVDCFDSYSFDLYASDLYNGITAENSILPEDQWNFIDTKVDLDNDGLAGTFVDLMIFQYVAGSPYEMPEYMLDIYYLELVEKKGFTDLSDIRPYIEKLCSGKETGDVDFDGKITALDATTVLSYYADEAIGEEVSLVTETVMSYMADCNSDGRVNSVDASDILSTYAENSVNR